MESGSELTREKMLKAIEIMDARQAAAFSPTLDCDFCDYVGQSTEPHGHKRICWECLSREGG